MWILTNIYRAAKPRGKCKPIIIDSEVTNCFSETSEDFTREKQRIVAGKTFLFMIISTAKPPAKRLQKLTFLIPTLETFYCIFSLISVFDKYIFFCF